VRINDSAEVDNLGSIVGVTVGSIGSVQARLNKVTGGLVDVERCSQVLSHNEGTDTILS